MNGHQELLSFNRGLVSERVLARTDVAKIKLGAAEMVNWWPDSLGPMSLRPGLAYKGATKSNAQAKLIPFVFAADDKALIELTDSIMRVWVNGSLVTRNTVDASIVNGIFTSLVGWVDQDEAGAVSDQIGGQYLGLTGSGTSAAIRRQTCTTTSTNIEHGLRVVVTAGVLGLRIGSTAGGTEFLDVTLGTGTHSLTFTPTTGTYYIDLYSYTEYATIVDTCLIETPGAVMELPTPWSAADLADLRFDQSGDIIFVACSGERQYKIERRATRAWSVVEYQVTDGPFRVINTSATTVYVNALTGTADVYSSAPIFKSGHLQGLIRISSVGQNVTESIAAGNVFGDPIRITGVGDARKFQLTLSGTFVATVTLQRSVGEPGTWQDVTTYTTATDVAYDDGLDNQIIYYRLGVKTGDYTSGTVSAAMSYQSGSITGIGRIVGVPSATHVVVDVLKTFGNTATTSDWALGGWCDELGFPSAVALYEGRLWWAGKDRFWGSVVDAFASFDEELEGDAGPISRTVGFGPVDVISWLLPMARLLAGTDGGVLAARSSSFDEPLTPTNFNVKSPSTQGSARVQAVKVDNRVVFVQRSGKRLFQMAYSVEDNDFRVSDLTGIVPEVGGGGIVALAVQRAPDTVIHCVRADGTAALLMFEPAEEILCWFEVETDGYIEDVCVLPGDGEVDEVYYVVRRTVNSATVRYIERYADADDCVGSDLSLLADSHVYSSGSPIASLSGLSHLEGRTVVVWADGQDLGEKTVSGGAVALGGTYTYVCAGLVYEARYKSTKLAYVAPAQGYSALTNVKRVNQIGVIVADTHARGLQYGRDFDNMDDMPLYDDEMTPIDEDAIIGALESKMVAFPGTWKTDSRLCMKAAAPRPATVMAAVIEVETHLK